MNVRCLPSNFTGKYLLHIRVCKYVCSWYRHVSGIIYQITVVDVFFNSTFLNGMVYALTKSHYKHLTSLYVCLPCLVSWVFVWVSLTFGLSTVSLERPVNSITDKSFITTGFPTGLRLFDLRIEYGSVSWDSHNVCIYTFVLNYESFVNSIRNTGTLSFYNSLWVFYVSIILIWYRITSQTCILRTSDVLSLFFFLFGHLFIFCLCLSVKSFFLRVYRMFVYIFVNWSDIFHLFYNKVWIVAPFL